MVRRAACFQWGGVALRERDLLRDGVRNRYKNSDKIRTGARNMQIEKKYNNFKFKKQSSNTNHETYKHTTSFDYTTTFGHTPYFPLLWSVSSMFSAVTIILIRPSSPVTFTGSFVIPFSAITTVKKLVRGYFWNFRGINLWNSNKRMIFFSFFMLLLLLLCCFFSVKKIGDNVAQKIQKFIKGDFQIANFFIFFFFFLLSFSSPSEPLSSEASEDSELELELSDSSFLDFFFFFLSAMRKEIFFHKVLKQGTWYKND